jgi:melibiose permease/lactose/raffinose/galactose permease
MEITKKNNLKLSNRSKYSYSVGGVGRDMTYTLVGTFFLTYIQFSGLGLSVAQFSTIGLILILGRVWDAINDPIMGTIIENTKSKWGKFKPWILLGALLTAVVTIIMFTYRPTGNDGWNYVIFFGVIYFLWEIAYTMNDISYWSMLPSLTSDAEDRNSVTTLAVVFAGVGAFLANAGISFYTTGNAVKGYAIISIIIAIFLIGCTLLTVLGVKQPLVDFDKHNDNPKEKVTEEKITVKKMFRVISKNDQLLWLVLAMLVYNIGSNLLVALGYNFIYLELGYDGTLALIFVATFGVSNITIQTFYPKLVKKLGRNKLLYVSLLSIVSGYVLLFTLDIVPFIPINILTVCIFGAFIFAGQALFYMVLTVNIVNIVEYNEFKTGERNESIIFSLRPFMEKLASALQQGVVTLVLTTTGIYLLSQNINLLENQKAIFDDLSYSQQLIYQENVDEKRVVLDTDDYKNLTSEKKNQYYLILADVNYTNINGKLAMEITDAADTHFMDLSTTPMRVFLRSSITILPALLICTSYYVLKKKFKIDEEYYDFILTEINSRKGN